MESEKELLIKKIKEEYKTTKLKNITDVEMALSYWNLENKKLLRLLLNKNNTLEYIDDLFSKIKEKE